MKRENLHLYVVGRSKIVAFTEDRVKLVVRFLCEKNDEDYVAAAGHCARNTNVLFNK
ncbi:8436_t:CDS:1 [Gigaspora margarita]|uniref:8436_t:CDS:1 n=1 Tax=Gigaspora margarita TaxID=4874 RepID=A0ABN7WYI8_GIGMA|nr:8436_t:CDS:1 [Gigaspora margarita]